jgi:predicted outer membrane repeat protein
MKKTQTRALFFALFSTLVLGACSNYLIENPRTGSGGVLTDIPEGYGAVEIRLNQGVAKTIIPTVDLSSLYLKYVFIKDEGSPAEEIPVGGVFILEPGTYTLEVSAFADEPCTELVARGEADAAFTISVGVTAEPVNVTLRPVASEGTGSLEFILTYPAGTTVETLTLTRITGGEEPVDLKTEGTASGTDLSGTKSNIPAGYYLLRAELKNSAGTSGRSEVVHIYQNLTAEVTYVFDADDFRVYRVTSNGDSGPGTLRQALTDVQAVAVGPQTIQVVLEPGAVIELASALPWITKSITVEGNGVTLTRAASWTASSNTSQLLYINSSAAIVNIRRVRFKDGLATDYGAAIRNSGTLTLESCIFSGNRTTENYASGGAVYSTNTLTIRGCTFYNNSSSYYGGAVDFSASGKTLTLEGNLFYGNTAVVSVVYRNSGTVDASYNVVDVDLGTTNAQAGWAAGTGDLSIGAVPPVSGKSFKLLYGSGAAGKLTSLPANYPATDFYGDPISTGGAAGAVQAFTANQSGYYYLEYSQNNTLLGTVTPDSTLDVDGLYQGSLTLTATSNSGYSFRYWLVNGVMARANPLSLSGHSQVQAVFGRAVTVDTFTDGSGAAATPGTLRYALTNAQDDDDITFSGVPGTTIELESALPRITKSITIEGNGVTLTRAASWTASDTTSQLLYIDSSSATVSIRRVRFKDGLATSSGGAIQNRGGALTLESCIFSGNRGTASNASGGAIYSNKTLTIRGCTFYNNTSSGYGGAVLFSSGSGKTLTLEGNLFYGNTATLYYPVVWCANGTTSASYNVVDVALVAGISGAGFSATTGNTTFSNLSITGFPFDADFVPVAELQSPGVLPSTAPADFPATDFNGTTRTFPGAPGAVAKVP